MPFELINYMLAPSVCKDEQGRYVAIGIIADERNADAHYEAGWAHLFSLPRVWTFENQRLVQRPLPELEKLRGEHQHFENIELNSSAGNLPNISGRHLELKAVFNPQNALEVALIIGKTPDASEQTRILFTVSQNQVKVDRGNSSNGIGEPRDVRIGDYEFAEGEDISIHVFIDSSVVEVFMNDTETFATRIFPSNPESTGIDMTASFGTAILKSLDVWEMKSMNDPSVGIEAVPLLEEKKMIESVFPNPFTDVVNVDFQLDKPSNVEVLLYDLTGKVVLEERLGRLQGGRQSVRLEVGNLGLEQQTYLLELKVDGRYRDVRKVLR